VTLRRKLCNTEARACVRSRAKEGRDKTISEIISRCKKSDSFVPIFFHFYFSAEK